MEIPSEDPHENYRKAIKYTIDGLERLKQLIETPQEPDSSNEREQAEMIVRYRANIYQQLDQSMNGNKDIRETDVVIRQTNAAVFDLHQAMHVTPNPTAEDIDDWIDALNRLTVMTE